MINQLIAWISLKLIAQSCEFIAIQFNKLITKNVQYEKRIMKQHEIFVNYIYSVKHVSCVSSNWVFINNLRYTFVHSYNFKLKKMNE